MKPCIYLLTISGEAGTGGSRRGKYMSDGGPGEPVCTNTANQSVLTVPRRRLDLKGERKSR